MTLTKKDINKSIANRNSITDIQAKLFLKSFLSLIKENSKKKTVKVNNFGTFAFKLTPSRLGRNPKTGESHKINAFKRLTFKPSSRLKFFIN